MANVESLNRTLCLEDRSKPVLVVRENFMNAEFSVFFHRQICKIEVLNGLVAIWS